MSLEVDNMAEAPALDSYNGGSSLHRVLLSNTPHFCHFPAQAELAIRRIQVTYELFLQPRLQDGFILLQ